MPYANNNGVKIYYEVEGQGPPLVLAHGLSQNLSFWRMAGYADALRDDFQLITIDARGHGKSDKPHEVSAYGLKMANDVVAVLDHIGLNSAHYFGYSMGARVGFWLAVRHTTRFRSFILGGTSPYRSEAEIKVEQELMDRMKLLLSDPKAYLIWAEQMRGRTLTSEDKEAILANDGHALIAVLTSFRDMPLTDHELSLIPTPCFIFCGELDPRQAGAKDGASHIPGARFVSLTGLDHGAVLRTNLVLPIVKEFLARVSKQ